MRKKLNILILLIIGLFFILATPSFAKEMTVQEIGAEIEKEHPYAVYAYVIGEYVYTSDSTSRLDTQDIMLAARSIKAEEQDGKTKNDAIYGKMTIHQLDRTDDGWEVAKNYVGDTILNPTDKLDIRYINYQYDTEDTKIKVSFDNVDTLLEQLKDKLKYEKNPGNLTLDETGKLTGLIERNNQVDTSVFPQEELTGYYFAYTLKVEGEITDATTVKLTNGDSDPKTLVGKSAFDELENGLMLILAHLDKNAENKTLKVEVDLDGEGTEYLPAVYTIDWSDLDFQSESEYTKANIGATTEDSSAEGYISSEDKTKIEGWGYDFSNAGYDLKIEKQEGEEPYKLTGKVKQQKVENAGFKEADGYYVVVKVYGPDESQSENNHFLSQEGNLKKWTVQLKNEDGNYKDAITPNEEEYNNGFITVLFKLKNINSDKKITYKIDWDGEGNYYSPYEQTIDYSELTFLQAHEINLNGSGKTVTVWDGEEIPIDEIQTIEPQTEENTYHSFAYWTKEDGTKIDDLTLDNLLDENGNVTLIPHWNLYSDKFISDVIADLNLPKGKEDGSHSEDFHEKFVFEQDKVDSSNIKIRIVNPSITLSEMNKTSIPGAIAYVLEKDEIKEITLEVNPENKTTFDKNGVKVEDGIALAEELTLKEKIQEGVKALYAKVLGGEGKDNETTLSAMALTNPSFKLTIGSVDKTVTLASEDGQTTPTEYTFTFDSSVVAVVKNEAELKQALSKETINEIFIADNIELGDINNDEKHSHTLIIDLTDANRKVTIKSLDKTNLKTISDKERTEEGESDKTPVIEVKVGEVTFEDIKIEGATRAISVKSGATVTANNVEAIDSQDTAFDVAEGATFTGTGLKYLKTTEDGNTIDKESYHYPTICGKGTVTVTDKQVKKVTDYNRIEYSKKGNYEDMDFRDPETHQYYPEYQDPSDPNKLKEETKKLIGTPRNMVWDELRNTGHTHYYLDAENAEYYMIYLRDVAITRKYFAKGDKIEKTPENYKTSGYYKNVLIVDGKSYVHDGWSKQGYYYLSGGQKIYTWNTPKVTEPKVAGNGTMYPRYVEGYSVTITVDDVKMRFGVIKETPKSMNDLMNEIPEFKEAYETLRKKATEQSKKVVDKNNQSEQLNLETRITKDMELIVEGDPINSEIHFEGLSVQGLTTNGNSISGI